MAGINANIGITVTAGDSRYYPQTSFVTAATANSPVKTLSTTGLLDPTLTSQDQTKEPTGFVNRTDSVLSFDNATRTFTITGVNFVVYSAGVKLTKNTETLNPPIPNTTGLYWIYYAPTTYALTANISPPAFNSGAILIATVYWNATKGEGLPPDDERHLIVMDWNTHEYLHKTIGARYESGLTGTFTDATMAVTGGTIWDEDIELTIPPVTQCIVLYRDGLEWEWTALNNTVHYETGGNVQYDNAGAITPAGANDYVAYWVFATNNITYPIISIMGQRTDGTIANARANNTYQSLSFGDLPFVEYKLLYRVIVRNDATPYEETQDLRSVSNVPSGTYVATDHGVLTGLLDDDHTQYQLRSEFIDATAGATDAGKPIKTDAGGLIDSSFLPPTTSAVNNFSAGRLCLATGDPDTINQTGSATLYWTPYNGNTISLIIGGVITEKTFTEQSIDFSAKTAAKPYDIFAYWDSGLGEVKIEELVWTDDTTRATALTLSNGVYYKSGDTTRKYLGTVYAYDDAGTTKIRDEESYRYVDNFYNKISKPCLAKNTTIWTYATNTEREWNGGTSMTRMLIVCGLARGISISMALTVRESVATMVAYYGISQNSTVTSIVTATATGTIYRSVSVVENALISAGLNYITGTEKVASGTAETQKARITAQITC